MQTCHGKYSLILYILYCSRELLWLSCDFWLYFRYLWFNDEFRFIYQLWWLNGTFPTICLKYQISSDLYINYSLMWLRLVTSLFHHVSLDICSILWEPLYPPLRPVYQRLDSTPCRVGRGQLVRLDGRRPFLLDRRDRLSYWTGWSSFSYNKDWTNVAASKVALVFLLVKLNGFLVVHVGRKFLINQLYKSSFLTSWAYFLCRWTGNLMSLGRNHMLPGVDKKASYLTAGPTTHLGRARRPPVSQKEQHATWPEVGSFFCLSSGTQAAWVYIHICSLEC
jgi:hypothetical protein